MTTVFIAGSISISRLHKKVQERIGKIVSSNLDVVVGDADGADTSIQKCLHDYQAEKVTVYCTGDLPRNNVADWPIHNVYSKAKAGSRAYFTAKDLEMARKSDYGLMIWDCKSTGTLSNVIELLREKKKSVVFVNKSSDFVKVSDKAGLDHLLTFMSANARAKAEEKLNLSSMIAGIAQEQLSLDSAGNERSSAGEEATLSFVAEMGEPLGSQYAELWQEIAQLHITWLEYVELYGTKKSRVDLLNDVAPHFFRMVQDRLQEAVMLHIARLTDPSHSLGNKAKSNLTLQNLSALIGDPNLKVEVERLCLAASKAVEFARDWRNRHIAHRDLQLAIGKNATPLPAIELKQVNEVLASFEAILNTISLHYSKTESRFGLGSRHGGAVELIYVLDDGLRAQKARQQRLIAGNSSHDDLEASDL